MDVKEARELSKKYRLRQKALEDTYLAEWKTGKEKWAKNIQDAIKTEANSTGKECIFLSYKLEEACWRAIVRAGFVLEVLENGTWLYWDCREV